MPSKEKSLMGKYFYVSESNSGKINALYVLKYTPEVGKAQDVHKNLINLKKPLKNKYLRNEHTSRIQIKETFQLG